MAGGWLDRVVSEADMRPPLHLWSIAHLLVVGTQHAGSQHEVDDCAPAQADSGNLVVPLHAMPLTMLLLCVRQEIMQ